MKTDFNIEDFLSLAGYATEKRKSRRKGPGGSAEYFTPYRLIKKMCDKISEEKWSDINANFLEPSFGNGSFLVYIIYNKIMHGSTWREALLHVYGVELMEDNVKEAHNRILKLLDNMGIQFDEDEARRIMDHNLVCSDFFKWDYQRWCPIKEDKINPLF